MNRILIAIGVALLLAILAPLPSQAGDDKCGVEKRVFSRLWTQITSLPGSPYTRLGSFQTVQIDTLYD